MPLTNLDNSTTTSEPTRTQKAKLVRQFSICREPSVKNLEEMSQEKSLVKNFDEMSELKLPRKKLNEMFQSQSVNWAPSEEHVVSLIYQYFM